MTSLVESYEKSVQENQEEEALRWLYGDSRLIIIAGRFVMLKPYETRNHNTHMCYQ